MPLAHYPLRGNILKPKVGTNTTGNSKDGYEIQYSNVPMYFETLTSRGREYWEAKNIHSETLGRIRIRYLADISTNAIIELDGRVLVVIPPMDNVNGRNRELIMNVKEIT